MLVYIGMIIISLVFAILANKTKSKIRKIIYYIGICIPFIIVSGIRYDVGTDYMFRYVPNYISISEGKNVTSLEPIFLLIIKICLIFSNDYALLFIVTSTITITLIMISIFKNSKNIIMSVIIFFVGSFFFQSMNLVRQFMAMAVIILSYKLLFNKKTIIFWLCSSVVAVLIHSMSVVILIAIVFDKKVFDYRIVLACSAIFAFFGKNVIKFVLSLAENSNITNIAKYAHYAEQGGNLIWSSLIVEFLIYVYFIVIYNNAKKNEIKLEKEGIFFINAQATVFFAIVMNVHIDLFFRVSIVFSMFQLISIPYFYNISKKCEFKILKNNRLLNNINLINKGIVVVILLLMTSRMTFSNIIKGSDEILPYKTIFSDERKEK